MSGAPPNQGQPQGTWYPPYQNPPQQAPPPNYQQPPPNYQPPPPNYQPPPPNYQQPPPNYQQPPPNYQPPPPNYQPPPPNYQQPPAYYQPQGVYLVQPVYPQPQVAGPPNLQGVGVNDAAKKNTGGVCGCDPFQCGKATAIVILVYCALRVVQTIVTFYVIFSQTNNNYADYGSPVPVYEPELEYEEGSVNLEQTMSLSLSCVIIVASAAFAIAVLCTLNKTGCAGLWAPIGLTCAGASDILYGFYLLIRSMMALAQPDANYNNDYGLYNVLFVIGLIRLCLAFYAWGIAALVALIRYQKSKNGEANTAATPAVL